MARYDFISSEEVQGYLPCFKDGKWGLVSYDDYDKEIFPPTWDKIPVEEQYGFILIKNKNKVGLLNRRGEEIIPAIYDILLIEKEDIIVADRMDDRSGIFDSSGKEVIPFYYNSLEYITDDFIVASKRDKYGVITRDETVVIPFDYDKIIYNGIDLFEVRKDGKCGVIDFSQREVLPCKYDKIFVQEKHIIVHYKGKEGLYDSKGNELIGPYEYNCIRPNENGLYIVGQDNCYGVTRLKGNRITACKYNKIYPFKFGYARIKYKSGRYNFINEQGKEITYQGFDFAEDFVGGMAAVKRNNKWGFIDTSGNISVSFIYDTVKEFDETGYALVCINSLWTRIDKNGKEILPCIYEYIGPVQNDIVHVVYKGNIGIVKL